MKKIIRAAVIASSLILMTPAIAAAAPASNQQGLVNQQIEPAQVKDAQPQDKINNQPAQSANAASSSSQASDQHSSNQGNGQESQTYTQQFQNTNTTLSGKSVRSTTYFNKIDYWDVKKATFNLTYATTQLRNDQASNITVSLNGVKFYSFKPSNNDGQQTISIDLPLNLLQSSNVLTIQGQIIDQNQSGDPESTPANWLTIYNGSNVNFSYDVKQPDNQISAFYSHFTGNDTVSNHQSVILVPAKASNDELAAATYVLTGISRVLTTNDAKVNISSLADSSMNDQPYQIVIAKYDQLPQEYRKAVNASDLQNGKAILKFVNGKDKKVLVVTAKNASSLIQAGKYISNEELMKQTTADSASKTRTVCPIVARFSFTTGPTKVIVYSWSPILICCPACKVTGVRSVNCCRTATCRSMGAASSSNKIKNGSPFWRAAGPTSLITAFIIRHSHYYRSHFTTPRLRFSG